MPRVKATEQSPFVRRRPRLAIAPLRLCECEGTAQPEVGQAAFGAVETKPIERPRVEALLETAVSRSAVVSVKAPAGFGKTTAVAAWVARSGRSWGWTTLDGGHADPERFWMGVLEALRSIRDGLGDGFLDALRAPGLGEGEALAV